MNTKAANRLRIISIVLLFFVGINALVAGALFIVAPSGKLLGVTAELLKHSPFSSFLIPGIILFSVIGMASIFIAIYTIRKLQSYPHLIWLQGCILIGWIGIQIILLQQLNPMHFIIGGIGFLLVLSGILLPNR